MLVDVMDESRKSIRDRKLSTIIIQQLFFGIYFLSVKQDLTRAIRKNVNFAFHGCIFP